jgi:hypothetical protein
MLKVIGTFFFGAALAAIPAFAVDGTTLINQASVMAAGGFPFTISQAGSYKLSSNLEAPAGANGINIQANDVTLDLNGFTINGAITCPQGANSCGPAPRIDTAGVQAFALGITIRNGHVKGFSRGVKLFGGLVEEIHASSNLIDGIEGNDSVIRRNDTSFNKGIGIQCFNCVVSENVSTLNGGNGFNMGGGGVFSANTMKSSLGTQLEITILVVSTHSSSCDGNPCL